MIEVLYYSWENGTEERNAKEVDTENVEYTENVEGKGGAAKQS